MKICIAGKNSIAVNALHYLIYEDIVSKSDIFVVCNSNDDGIDSWQPSLKKAALDLGVEIKVLSDLYDIKDLLFISLEFDRLLKIEKFRSKRLFNIHFSLLPAYKGMYTSTWPILNGEKNSGVTLHKIDNGIDTGDIIAQRSFEIPIWFTARNLYFKYLEEGLNLFKENIHKLIREEFRALPQPFEGASYYDKNSIDFKNLKINLNKTSFEIYNQIRAFIFPEYQLPVIDGFEIERIEFTEKKIKPCSIVKEVDKILLSGIDGYELIAYFSTSN